MSFKNFKFIRVMLVCMLLFVPSTKADDPIKSVAVFCSSTDKLPKDFIEATKILGKILAERNIHIYFGGSRTGLMGVLADAALDAGGTLTGVMPEVGKAWGVDHKKVQKLFYVEGIYQRLEHFDRADAFIALPGGLGTLSELSNVLAQKQYGIHKKPVILVNVNGFFDGLIAQFTHFVDSNTMKSQHHHLYTVIRGTDELLAALGEEKDGFIREAWWEK